MSFCKNVCGNDDLLGELMQEAAGNSQNHDTNEKQNKIKGNKKINKTFCKILNSRLTLFLKIHK